MDVVLGDKLKCVRCSHEWQPRKIEVLVCPECKSPYWWKEKRKESDTDEGKDRKHSIRSTGVKG